MVFSTRVCNFVLAGGAGTRLHPLTRHRCKPALPFGARHRVVDFVLANFANSGFGPVQLLVQHHAASLIDAVRGQWGAVPDSIAISPPPDGGRYAGTADAVRQHLGLVRARQPDVVAVFGADHVYRMDLRQMLDFHLTQQADITVAAIPVPLAQCHQFGVLQTASDRRVVSFLEKPQRAEACARWPGMVLASMGNYLFSPEVLARELPRLAEAGGTDFGQHVLPALLQRYRVLAYDFPDNRVPGVQPGEERGYWRDIGTIDAYFQALLDTLGPRPAFPMHNPRWPARAWPAGASVPADVIDGEMVDCSVAPGVFVDRAAMQRVVAGAAAEVHRGAHLERCVLMEGASVGAGARLRNVIVDEQTAVPAGEVIGWNAELDRARFHVSAGGVVVVHRGVFDAGRSRPAAPAVAIASGAPAAGELRARG